jgi:hypothetical protein
LTIIDLWLALASLMPAQCSLFEVQLQLSYFYDLTTNFQEINYKQRFFERSLSLKMQMRHQIVFCCYNSLDLI